MNCSVKWLISRPMYRYFFVFIIFLFFLNIVLISHIVDLQILLQNILYEAEWSSTPGTGSKSFLPRVLPNTSLDDCNVTDKTALDAFDRMRTQECRIAARRLLCSLELAKPLSLSNTCPKFDAQIKKNLIGCFSDSKFARSLSGHHYKFVHENSPEYCVDACLRAGYRLAGVEYQNECHCGDELLNATELPLKSCRTYACPSDRNKRCGGFDAFAVYTTGIRDKSSLIIEYEQPLYDKKADVQILFLLQLNGRNSRQIRRLLRIIYSPRHLYLIHIDDRQTFMFNEMKKVESKLQFLGFRNFHVLNERFATIWGASNLLTMFLNGVKKAFNELEWTTWDFLLNISESDFPILPLSELEFHLSRNKHLNFLSSHGQSTGRFIQKQGLDFVFFQCENHMWRLGKRTNFPQNVRLDGGSDWVVLSRDFLNYSLSNETLPMTLRGIFSTVLLPVESFFHTLAMNSHFCDRFVKGNLRITNWKRKQGCRCAMLKSIVDWCGCSPLAFTTKDVSKIYEKAAKKRPAFFARKFESLVSQGAIAIAERQALKHRNYLLVPKEMSLLKTWVNYFSSSVDQSFLLNAWSRAMYANFFGTAGAIGVCSFAELRSLSAYKSNDRSPINTVADLRLICNDHEEMDIQLMIKQRKRLLYHKISSVEGFFLTDIRVGSNSDFKEDVMRNYAGLLSEKEEVVAQLWWKPDGTASETASNFSSPRLKVSFRNSRGRKILFELPPYDSIRGAQYAMLPKNESLPGEWSFQIEFSDKNGTYPIATTDFVIFPSDAHYISPKLTKRYFEVLAACSENKVTTMSLCNETSWSHSAPDPKSIFPVE